MQNLFFNHFLLFVLPFYQWIKTSFQSLGISIGNLIKLSLMYYRRIVINYPLNKGELSELCVKVEHSGSGDLERSWLDSGDLERFWMISDDLERIWLDSDVLARSWLMSRGLLAWFPSIELASAHGNSEGVSKSTI